MTATWWCLTYFWIPKKSKGELMGSCEQKAGNFYFLKVAARFTRLLTRSSQLVTTNSITFFRPYTQRMEVYTEDVNWFTDEVKERGLEGRSVQKLYPHHVLLSNSRHPPLKQRQKKKNRSILRFIRLMHTTYTQVERNRWKASTSPLHPSPKVIHPELKLLVRKPPTNPLGLGGVVGHL